MKKILGVFMILGITYCSVADTGDRDEAVTEATINQGPCDSIEKTASEGEGRTVTIKVPCDTPKVESSSSAH